MSDWEIVQNNISSKPTEQSDWEMVTNPISSQPPESLGMSALKAPYRIGEDVLRGGMGFVKDIPSYLESAKKEIPGLLGTLREHPGHVAMQTLAGSQELINNLSQFPLNVAKYGSQRLNLLPQSVLQDISKITPEDTTQSIHQLFGEPQYPGEALMRGAARNIPEIFGASKLADVLNPMNYTAKSIAKNIIKSGDEQISKHEKLYNNLWADAKKSGFEEVPVNTNQLSNNLSVIEKYKTPMEYQSLKNLIESPTLSNAQKAQSDMGIMKRKLEDESRASSLTSEKLALHDAAKKAEQHIEDNMFKNNLGETNSKLKNRYDVVTKSYRDNVVPYRYNTDIQAFKNKELLAKQLKQRLSLGEFAAKKGSEHPELFRGDQIKNALIALGIGGGSLAGGKTIYDYLYGNK